MRSIITTYPECQPLPREVKIMVLAAGGHAFERADAPRNDGREKAPAMTHGLPTDDPIQIQSSPS